MKNKMKDRNKNNLPCYIVTNAQASYYVCENSSQKAHKVDIFFWFNEQN